MDVGAGEEVQDVEGPCSYVKGDWEVDDGWMDWVAVALLVSGMGVMMRMGMESHTQS